MEIFWFWVLISLLMFYTLINFVVNIALFTKFLELTPTKSMLFFVMITLSTVFLWVALFTEFPLSFFER